MEKPKIIIVGLGWACAAFLQTIDTSKFDVEVYSADSKFVYTPLLAQNAKQQKELTLHGKDINNRVQFKSREILDVHFQKNTVQISNTETPSYDFLVLSHGATTNTFGIKGVDDNCFFLKNAEQADKLRNKLQSLPDGSHVAVIGCGLTGTELVGALLDYHKFHIHAVDALPRPITMFHEDQSSFALELWKQNKVNIYMNHMVSSIDEKEIHFKDDKQIAYDIAVWCGGIKKSPLTDKLLQNLQIEHGKGIPVDSMLQVEKTKNVYAMGDCAFSGCPPTAQVAFQQGKYLAQHFNRDFKDEKPFRFVNKGQIGYIGMGKSVCQLPYFQGGGNMVYYLNKMIHVYNGVTWKQKTNLL